MLKRRTPLKRSSAPLRRTRIKPVSDRRRRELSEYSKRRRIYLEDHPVCEVWCKLHGWRWVSAGLYRDNFDSLAAPADALIEMGAPAATEIHHKAKRRRGALNEESKWLAVCQKNHQRIERNLTWARLKGFSENF